MSSETTNTSDSEYAIEVNGLGKCYQIYDKPSDRLKQMLMRGRNQYYKEFWALKDVSFKVKKGQTVGIIGRNGSGKSTLLQLICGTLNPTAGTIKVNGRIAALLELGAGFNPEFSGIDNVYMAASLYGLSKEEVDKRFDAIALFADIGDHIYQPVKTYSSGMYVRLAFAVIAHVDADILVVDEALAVGDAFFTQKCMRYLRNFMEKGTVLFVSHDTAAVINLCDTAVWLDRGSILANGSPKGISEDYLATLYNSKPSITAKTKPLPKQEEDAFKRTHRDDPRLALINSSNLRNDLFVYQFSNENVRDFGEGNASITDVRLETIAGERVSQCIGGETVELKISIQAISDISQPIIGFSLKDRLGQVLFGDNTYISHMNDSLQFSAGENYIASFRFQIPILPQGEYTISTAIATGTQLDHRQEHWIHDALAIKSISSSVSTGLIGIPMSQILINKLESA